MDHPSLTFWSSKRSGAADSSRNVKLECGRWIFLSSLHGVPNNLYRNSENWCRFHRCITLCLFCLLQFLFTICTLIKNRDRRTWKNLRRDGRENFSVLRYCKFPPQFSHAECVIQCAHFLRVCIYKWYTNLEWGRWSRSKEKEGEREKERIGGLSWRIRAGKRRRNNSRTMM